MTIRFFNFYWQLLINGQVMECEAFNHCIKRSCGVRSSRFWFRHMVRPKNIIKIISIGLIYLNGTNLLCLCLFQYGIEHCCRLAPSSNVILVQNFTLTRDHNFHLIELNMIFSCGFNDPCLRVVDPRSSTCSSIIRSASLFGKRSPISVIVSANVGTACVKGWYHYR